MSNDRYPAPSADEVWSAQARVERLTDITKTYARMAIHQHLLGPLSEVEVLNLQADIDESGFPTAAEWDAAEQTHGHDIVGFLAAFLEYVPERVQPYIHYGLTSSDLTEYDLHTALEEHAYDMSERLQSLVAILDVRALRANDLRRAGRTHGQTAEATLLKHQLGVHAGVFSRIESALSRWKSPNKSPGPTGYSQLRYSPNPSTEVLSTQIIPRDHLLEWAAIYLRLANALDNLATFVRCGCRSEIGEFSEGASADRHGSSAMPGKKNPIESERVCGLARVARGHFLSLAEVSALWEDRDLSNSSTERIAVPGLASVVEYMTITMTRVVKDLVVHVDRINQNAKDPRTSANALQSRVQKEQKVDFLVASGIAKQMMKEDR